MRTEFRFQLEKGSKKYCCPACGKRRFVRFIDSITGEYLPEQYGRCDKGDGHYFLNPYQDGYAKTMNNEDQTTYSTMPDIYAKQKKISPHPLPPPISFDFETFKQTLKTSHYSKNVFIQNLLQNVAFPFEIDDVTKVVQLYRLGTVANGYRTGAITFPFMDVDGNVRAIQVKQFDLTNHTTGTDFLHSIIEKFYIRNNESIPDWLQAYKEQDKLITCLFGEHLLKKYPTNPIALVEAPKTAVYGTLYFGLPEEPENLLWLAVYNKSSFSFDKLKVLQGRDVYVFPDLSKHGSTFKEWNDKAKDFENRLPGTKFIFSTLLEELAPEVDKDKGFDLADYLIKQDWRLFRRKVLTEKSLLFPSVVGEASEQSEELETTIFSLLNPLPEDEVFVDEVVEESISENSQTWGQEISELENFFINNKLPSHPFKLNKCSVILNCSIFVENHLAAIKANNGKQIFIPYLDRLKQFKEQMQNSTAHQH